MSGFPTKTLKYAQLFPEAFFIFHTSLEDKRTYFVWAQKYIDVRLKKDTPNWSDQDTNSIKFPSDSVLGEKSGDAKIEKIMKTLSVKKNGLEFLFDFECLNNHWNNCKSGHDELLQCIDIAKKLRGHTIFHTRYTPPELKSDLFKLVEALEYFLLNPIQDDSSLDQVKVFSRVEMYITELNSTKMMFLNQDNMDHFYKDVYDTSPY